MSEATQFLPPDSSRKSGDKLPFAPFINSQKQTERVEQENKITQAATQRQAVIKKKPLLLQVAADSQRVNTYTIDFKTAQGDSSMVAITDSAAVTDTSAFRFADDDSEEQAIGEKTWSNSSPYFKTHQLQPTSQAPQLKQASVPDWFTIVLVLVVAGITVIKVFYSKIFTQLFNAFYSLAVTNQVVRDENILVQRASILLNITFYGTAGLFLYYMSVKFNWDHPVFNTGILRFFFFAFVTAVFFSVKMLLLKILSNIFEIEKPVSIYIFSIFLTNNMLGMVLVPLLTCLVFLSTGYSTYLIHACVVIILGAFAYLLYRAVVISSSLPRFSLYYLFLYFCTLEIAPLLLIIKTATR